MYKKTLALVSLLALLCAVTACGTEEVPRNSEAGSEVTQNSVLPDNTSSGSEGSETPVSGSETGSLEGNDISSNIFLTLSESLTDTCWVAETGPNLVFETNFSYYWFEDINVTDDNCHYGSYIFYQGKNAINFVTQDLSAYGITEEMLNKFLDGSKDRAEQNFICLVLNPTTEMIDGESVAYKDTFVPFYGFMPDDGKSFTVISMNGGTVYTFHKAE
ncbi:MAG: hypothetical protein IJ291_03335 [Lachnospiraceae bacterium]|nr:hypothetical protein [Lachnospiraceae bacterium]